MQVVHAQQSGAGSADCTGSGLPEGLAAVLRRSAPGRLLSVGSIPVGRTRAAAATLLTALLALTLVACGDDDAGTDVPQSGNRPTTAPADEADETAATATPSIDGDPQALLDARPYAVGQRTETLVDTSRDTQAVPAQGIAARPDRTLPLTILYPAEGDGGTDAGGSDAAPTTDAPVAEGRFPLLVFAHGWIGSGPSLIPTAQHWASAGYVVALPTFPLSKEGIGFSQDLPQQPADMRFVLDAVLGYGDDAGDPLEGHVDPDHIAVGGHSLGSATAFAFLNSCCEDPRIDAVIGASGGPLCCEGGEYPDEIPIPLLLVHGGRDTTVAHAASDFVFDTFGGDVNYLFLPEADHVSYFRGDDHELFSRTVVAFLDAELGLDPGALDGLADDVAAGGRGTFRTK
jgi:dienelactone hydrolase